MRTIRFILFLLFIVVFSLPDANAQCGYIWLNNQEDIDNFNKKYSNCSEVATLTIRDMNKDITNFDSLYKLTRITTHFSINDLSNTDEINISGLENLKYVGVLDYRIKNTVGAFTSLDTVRNLNIHLGSFAPFQHVKHIEEHLKIELTDVCGDKELPFFSTGDQFRMAINKKVGSDYSDTYKDCISHIASILDFNKDISLALSVDSFNLGWFPMLDRLDELWLNNHQNSDFSRISDLKSLNNIYVINDLGGNNYGAGLSQFEELEEVLFRNISVEAIDYTSFFSNLKKISIGFSISGDKFMTNLDFLEDVKIPDRVSPMSYTVMMVVHNNPNLRNCNVSFLCDALRRYPEEVVISQNAGLCTKEEVMKYCKLVSTSDTNEKAIELTPNPVTDYLKIKGLDKAMEYQIYNACGTGMMSGMTDSDIRVDHLSDGMYFIQLRSDSGAIISRKFVKM